MENDYVKINNYAQMDNSGKKGLNLSAKSFVTSIAVIFVLMIFSYVLTLIIPGGKFARVTNAEGKLIIDISRGFTNVKGGIPFWKWCLSPFLCLASEGGGTVITAIIFLFLIGAAFNSFEKCGLMKYMLAKTVYKYSSQRYTLQAVIILLFMLAGSVVGAFEECVPLIPIVVALAIGLGWDAKTGLMMSLFSIGYGFAAGICNPFTVGVAQSLVGLPLFSGIWLRFFAFALIYPSLIIWTRRYSKRIERPAESLENSFVADRKMDKALITFISIIVGGVIIVLCSSFIKILQNYTMIIIVLSFTAAAIACPLITGLNGKKLLAVYWNGILSLLPVTIMILMASSIKYTLVEANVLDTILNASIGAVKNLPKGLVIIFIYLIVLVMNFFIPSGSTKAFLLIPIIVPLAQVFHISPQLCIVAFAFGDGFSNLFYPTNSVLLISLGLADVDYGAWIRRTCRFQLINLLLTSCVLLLGIATKYN